MRVIEQEKGRYEVQEVPYGKVYSWHPGRVLVECDCGSVVEWRGPGTVCECGAECGGLLSDSGAWKGSGDHPWHEDYESWREQTDASGIQCEYFEFVGVNNGK